MFVAMSHSLHQHSISVVFMLLNLLILTSYGRHKKIYKSKVEVTS